MRSIILGLCLVLAPLGASAQGGALGLALDALAARDPVRAAEAAEALTDPVARDIVDWRRLRMGSDRFPEYEAFLRDNADWPGLPFLRRAGEASIVAGTDPARVLAYFAPEPPQTGAGVLALARALEATGDRAAAEAEAIRGWTSMTLDAESAANLRRAHGDVLNRGTHHIDRLDHLLWAGADAQARAMFPLVPRAWQALAEARLALRARRPGVDALVAAVPARLRDHPGLAYERFLWRIHSGFWDTAGDLMAEMSTSAGRLGRPEAWAPRRAALARDAMREGDFDTCHTHAARHHVDPATDRPAYADLEWIAGYCAHRLGRHARAVLHFQNFRGAVLSPISLGRAGYWLGRAHEAAGDARAAAEAYAQGARHQSSFYGQLAAERGGLPTDPAFLGDESFGDRRGAAFTRSDVFRAGLLLHDAGQDDLAERFLTHLAESLSRREAGQLADVALELGDAHLALRIAKRAARNGHEIMRAHYPLSALAEATLPVPRALALSITRRESEFDPSVVSHAGALGLMQVMPGTARDTARDLGVAYDEPRLLTDPDYNALLGSSYIADLIDRYDGNLPLVAIGYNAGPRRADRWIARFGDPRRAPDIAYWIEALPFSETRNYVMRVAESIPIYEARLTGKLPEPRLAARLRE